VIGLNLTRKQVANQCFADPLPLFSFLTLIFQTIGGKIQINDEDEMLSKFRPFKLNPLHQMYLALLSGTRSSNDVN